MNKSCCCPTLTLFLLFSIFPSSALMAADKPSSHGWIPYEGYAHHLPFPFLIDPLGIKHPREMFIGKISVFIVSVPNMSQGRKQEKWAKLLGEDPKTKLPSEVALILVEDISHAGFFKAMALSHIKKHFDEHSRPFPVIDYNGTLTRDFGVAKNSTQILIYDKSGNLYEVEKNLDNVDLTLNRIHKAIQRLEREKRHPHPST
ncbi:hypothetical protein [Candidatus Methylacidiphilum infernorum]|uniref:Uncharacterized protein n=1 Tax=Methylacidiphilum infernorum (isolate V4) TaxID=481448 RepID=B3DWX1_METI4|nr:hypothetical protein [Candidatus Methylacidiphilum infernorum]ACD82111.1 Conserved hypothetical protein [Methylacidiphilum infernorum V4]